LQIQQDGTFLPVANTTSDDHGRFAFHDLPVAGHPLYLVGADRDEVFHPGQRVRLDEAHPAAHAAIRVFDAITHPSPLVARKHDVIIRPEQNLLSVTETISIANPTLNCYVGGAEGKRPVTLKLKIPSNFAKVTFQKEFYGRRFDLIDGELMTTIPWPPGERELSFTYVVPIEQRKQLWERPLDLPCDDVSVTVLSGDLDSIKCNMGAGENSKGGTRVFRHVGHLAAGHTVRIEFGGLEVPFSVYARWLALTALAALVTMAAFVMVRKRSHRRMSGEFQEIESKRG
jgi:hypothetical protein